MQSYDIIVIGGGVYCGTPIISGLYGIPLFISGSMRHIV